MKLIVTKIGLDKIAKATLENPLKLTHFAVGDGEGKPIDPNENMTKLVNEKYRDHINSSYIHENNLIIECVLKANAPIEKGFKIFELGIFDKDGNLIAITQTPEQYRPSQSEGIATEWIASIVLKISNTENIKIEIPPTVFATVDALQRAISRIEKIEARSKQLIESSVGVDKWFNTDQKYKDWFLIKIGLKTWALMDPSNILKIQEFPTLFKNVNAVDRGNGTFAMPIFHNGTLRHLNRGHPRHLGSFEDCALQSHNHIMDHNHRHDHRHHLPDIHGYFECLALSGHDKFQGSFKQLHEWSSFLKTSSNGDNWMKGVHFSSHRIGVNHTDWIIHSGESPHKEHEVWTNFHRGPTANNGVEETRMKNTAGQWYILAKIDF